MLSRRQYDQGNAGLVIQVADTSTDTVAGQQRAAVFKPSTFGIFAKRDPPI